MFATTRPTRPVGQHSLSRINSRPRRTSLRSYLAAAVILVATASGCSDESSPATPAAPRASATPPPTLTIVTPHNEVIRRAFEEGFASWHLAKHKSWVRIEWVALGTPQCVQYVNDVYAKAGEDRPHQIPDLMFGGGLSDHQTFVKRAYSRPVKLGDLLKDVPATVGGLPTHDADGRWCSTGLSSFGIVFNETACRQRNLAPPTTWKDLGDPRFRSWIGLADPSRSGSHKRCMTIILQQLGWQEGWGTLVRILANSRGLMPRSADVLNQVAGGIALTGFSVNFDGQEVAESTAGRVRYVNPAGATMAEPDVVTLLTCGKNAALAEDFVRYCLSDDGQSLWSVRGGGRTAGGQTLYHFPISRDVYKRHAAKLAVKENPLETDFGLKFNIDASEKQAAILEPLVAAACGDNHVLLQQAWDAIVAKGLPAPAVAELTAPPFDEAQAMDLGQKYRAATGDAAKAMQTEWSKLFAAKFKKALELATGPS